MDINNVLICDIETDGLLDVTTKLHVLSCAYRSNGSWKIKSTKNYEDIKNLFENPDKTIVGHNFISFDVAAIKKLYPDIEIKASIIDTLPLSYYLYSELEKHGLESWGERFGVHKIKIDDWEGLPYEEYKERCEVDCKINVNLWLKIIKFLRVLYDNDEQAIIRVINYFNHKANCLAIQDRNPILIDTVQCQKNLDFLEVIIKEKEQELQEILPKVEKKAKRTPPAKPYKQDGTLSATGIKWFTLLEEHKLPDDYDGEVEVIAGYSEPNGSSVPQMKDYLTSLGWKPTMFNPGANGKVPQLRDDDKVLCPNIYRLIEEHPKLIALDGLSVATHRAGYLKAFLDKSDDRGYAKAWAHGFARTLRLKHVKPFVNLPKPNSQYGELVRSCMVAPEGYVMIGADLSSIEDKCKQISILYLDPEYVESMNKKGWDAHLALGSRAGMFTKDEADFYKWYKNKDKEENSFECPESFKGLTEDEMYDAFGVLDKKRSVAKTTNYAATYGAGAPRIAEAAGIPMREAKELHRGYWDLNWAVKRFAKDRIVKTVESPTYLRKSKKVGGITLVNKTNWIWNEYSEMWLYLRNDKDRFSACNQNFGVKVFDTWLWYLIRYGILPIFQSHDEALWYCREDLVDDHIEILNNSVIWLNKIFNPPVPLEIDYKVGKNYAEVH